MHIRVMPGDCRDRLNELADRSVHTCITSPPYFGLRDYDVEGQIGGERQLKEFIAAIVDVFRNVRRVLRDDGTVWLNIGDTYARGSVGRKDTGNGKYGGPIQATKDREVPGFKNKNLLMIPARVAIALQEDGWYLRSEIIWHKPNPMPENVFDRPTRCHEKIFLLSKSESYFYDQDAIREPTQDRADCKFHPIGRNKRDVWFDASSEFWSVSPNKNYSSEIHFAMFPPRLVAPCVLAGTSAGGVCVICGAPLRRHYSETRELSWQYSCSHEGMPIVPAMVLDPFFGLGSTGVAALENGRSIIGIEMNPTYAAKAHRRMEVLRLLAKPHNCLDCDVRLACGVNWDESRVLKHDYICKDCKNKRGYHTVKVRQSSFANLQIEQNVNDIIALTQVKNEVSHVQNPAGISEAVANEEIGSRAGRRLSACRQESDCAGT